MLPLVEVRLLDPPLAAFPARSWVTSGRLLTLPVTTHAVVPAAGSSPLCQGSGHTGRVKVRYKLSGAPLGYTLAKVEGAADPYTTFGKAIWSDDAAISPAMKELVFLRTSIVNQCPT